MITDDEFKTLSELLGYPNPEGLPPAEARLRDFARRLVAESDLKRQHETAALDSDSIVAACNCGVKSPETRYHKVGCKYRLIEERNVLKRLLGETRDALVKARERIKYTDPKILGMQEIDDALARIDATLDPDCLEGPPRTREERAADARELDAVAPTPGDKFALMMRNPDYVDAPMQVSVTTIDPATGEVKQRVAESEEEVRAFFCCGEQAGLRAAYHKILEDDEQP